MSSLHCYTLLICWSCWLVQHYTYTVQSSPMFLAGCVCVSFSIPGLLFFPFHSISFRIVRNCSDGTFPHKDQITCNLDFVGWLLGWKEGITFVQLLLCGIGSVVAADVVSQSISVCCCFVFYSCCPRWWLCTFKKSPFSVSNSLSLHHFFCRIIDRYGVTLVCGWCYFCSFKLLIPFLFWIN